jgi:hypothetical protein
MIVIQEHEAERAYSFSYNGKASNIDDENVDSAHVTEDEGKSMMVQSAEKSLFHEK